MATTVTALVPLPPPPPTLLVVVLAAAEASALVAVTPAAMGPSVAGAPGSGSAARRVQRAGGNVGDQARGGIGRKTLCRRRLGGGGGGGGPCGCRSLPFPRCSALRPCKTRLWAAAGGAHSRGRRPFVLGHSGRAPGAPAALGAGRHVTDGSDQACKACMRLLQRK